jgi:hypothetical protein
VDFWGPVVIDGKPDKSDLHLVAVKKVVLIAARALGALKAAHEQNCHTRGHNHGQQIRVRRKPVNKRMHKATPNLNEAKRTKGDFY